MAVSSMIVVLGIGLGWVLYGRKPIEDSDAPDALEQIQPHIFSILEHAFYIDRIYGATIVRANAGFAVLSDFLDRWVWNGAVQTFSFLVRTLAQLDNFFDTYLVNGSFDAGCQTVSLSGRTLSFLQNGRVQNYLKMIGLALIVLLIFMLWGAKA